MRRITKTGKVYNVGSEMTLGDYPRVCTGCGGPVYLTSKKDTRPLWFSTDNKGVKRSWHFYCNPLVKPP